MKHRPCGYPQISRFAEAKQLFISYRYSVLVAYIALFWKKTNRYFVYIFHLYIFYLLLLGIENKFEHLQ